MKPVCLGLGSQDSRWCPEDCLTEGGREETADCVQWSAAVACVCPGSHGLSTAQSFELTTLEMLRFFSLTYEPHLLCS